MSFKITILSLVAGAALLIVPSPASAASSLDKTTPALAPPTTVSIPPNLIKAWKGLYQLPTFSLVYKPEPSFMRLMNNYVGRGGNPGRSAYRTYYYNPAAIYQWLNATLGQSIDVPASEPDMEIENGRVVKFTPPQTGRTLNLYQTTLSVIQSLEAGETTAQLTIDTAQPATQLGDLNNLGIKELISRGQSNFGNSPANRKHNIAIGVDKMKGVIIAPGDTFSFNKYLGPVEAAEGFLPELVIKATGTVPEFGGGLCQVSSTTFRAAMQAGLPITERRNHSYAVSYYAPQGTDATIYPGVQDLKFVNDTPGSILIWPYFGPGTTLFFDFYGTKDSRQVILDNPVQYARQANGAMKAYWTRTVIKNGAKDTHTFNSVYQPPALFHKQEQFVASPTPPAAETPAGSTPAPGTPGASEPPSSNGTITPTTPPPAPPATSTSL
jgi:vancomycin resistance protein YoaR